MSAQVNGVMALPVSHERSPGSTAKKGVRRLPVELGPLLGRRMQRARALELVSSSNVRPDGATVVWKVAGRTVIEDIGRASLPPIDLLDPVRRLGSYPGAPNQIAMLPVVRGGRAFMLTLDSGLEFAWAAALDMHPDVDDVFAQPLLVVWSHDEGSIVHVPDLAVTTDDGLLVLEVKPDYRLEDPWIKARSHLMQETMQLAGFDYQVLGGVAKQKALALRELVTYRCPNPYLAVETDAAATSTADTVWGRMAAVIGVRARGGGWWPHYEHSEAHPLRDDDAGETRLSFAVAMEVVKHLVASGRVYAELDDGLQLWTQLSAEAPPVTSWGVL